MGTAHRKPIARAFIRGTCRLREGLNSATSHLEQNVGEAPTEFRSERRGGGVYDTKNTKTAQASISLLETAKKK